MESLLAGLLEACILVVVVATGLALTDGHAAVDITLPIIQPMTLSLRSGIGLGIVAGAGAILLHIHLAWTIGRLSSGVLERARLQVLGAFSNASWSRQSQESEGALQESATSLSIQTAALVLALMQMVTQSFGLLALVLVAVAVNPAVTAAVLVLGAGLFGVLRPLTRATRRRSKLFVARNSAFSEALTEWSGLSRELRAFGVEQAVLDGLVAENKATSDRYFSSRFANTLASSLLRDVVMLFLVVALAGATLVESLDVATLGSIVLLIVRALGYAQAANSAFQNVNHHHPNLEALLGRVSSLKAESWSVGDAAISSIGRIECRSVSYSYQGASHAVADISLTIEPGETLGIVGPSGSGKSTLMELILRLRLPTMGEIEVDGEPYESFGEESWRRLVGFVPQEPRLFQGTIRENIAFHRAFSDGQLTEAAARAQILDEIRATPDGFETKLGPRGLGLSGGQKQRVAIARALIGSPSLLVLDEPTSALDGRSEQLLQGTIDSLRGGITLVIVAHRLSTLQSCDRVISLSGGRLHAVGSWESVLNRAVGPAS